MCRGLPQETATVEDCSRIAAKFQLASPADRCAFTSNHVVWWAPPERACYTRKNVPAEEQASRRALALFVAAAALLPL